MENNENRGGGNDPNRPGQPNRKPNGKRRFNMMWIYAILALVLLGVNFLWNDSKAPQEDIDQGKLIELLEKQQVQRIDLVNGKDAEIYLNERGLAEYFPSAPTTDKGTTATPSYTFRIGDLGRFEEMVKRCRRIKRFKIPYISTMWSARAGFLTS